MVVLHTPVGVVFTGDDRPHIEVITGSCWRTVRLRSQHLDGDGQWWSAFNDPEFGDEDGVRLVPSAQTRPARRPPPSP